MPTTIQNPIVGAPFGPGFEIQLSSTFIGPIDGPFWQVDIITTDTEHILYSQAIPTNSPGFSTDAFYIGFVGTPIPNKFTIHGADVTLSVKLTGSAGVVETTTRAVKLDEIQGRIMEVSNKVAQVSAQVSALSGFTAPQFDAILAGITSTFGGTIAQTIGQFFTRPPLSAVTRELIGDFSGSVSFTRTAPGVGVNAFGITWEVISYGGGIGLDTGVPVRFETELLDLAVVYGDADAHEFVGSADVYVFSNYYRFFDPAFPKRIDVVIAPSVVLRFYWLLVG